MVKKRTPLAVSKTPTNEEIEAFAAGADKSRVNQPAQNLKRLDPTAKKDFKAISIPFNEYEFNLLTKASEKAGRSKLNFIRNAIVNAATGEIDQ